MALLITPSALHAARNVTGKPGFPLKRAGLSRVPNVLIYGAPNTGKTGNALGAVPDAKVFSLGNSHLTAAGRFGVVAQGTELGGHTPVPVVSDRYKSMAQGVKYAGGSNVSVNFLGLKLLARALSESKDPSRPVVLDEWSNWVDMVKRGLIDGLALNQKGEVDTGVEWREMAAQLNNVFCAASAVGTPLIVLGHESEAQVKEYMGKSTAYKEGVRMPSLKQAADFSTLFDLRLRTATRILGDGPRFVYEADPVKPQATQTDRSGVIPRVCPANLRAVLGASGYLPGWAHYRQTGDGIVRIDGDRAGQIGAAADAAIQELLGGLWSLPNSITQDQIEAGFRQVKRSLRVRLAEVAAEDPTLVTWVWEYCRDAAELVVAYYEQEESSI